VLGSLLSLGIERDVLGDIAFVDSSGFLAVLFCDRVIADYIKAELSRVANDAVKVAIKDIDADFEPYRSFLHISDTVASPRIDSVVAALCSLSREKARAAVVGELVEVDFMSEIRPDRQISAPCTVSVRGFGRFRINSVSDQTRKGRFRLDADKYL
jgi:RNA-binding protein YlmH